MTPSQLQAQALVEALQQQAQAQRQALLDAAAQEAAALRARAAEKAGQQLRRASAELRAAGRSALQQAQAEIESARRRVETQRIRQALDAAWPRLDAALRRRWQDPAAREAWIAGLAAGARARLHGPPLQVRHPVDLDAAALAPVLARTLGPVAATTQPDPAVDAGLVIEADGAWIDGRPDALRADRARVEALLRAGLAGESR